MKDLQNNIWFQLALVIGLAFGIWYVGANVWPNTEEMALQWIDEALRELGYAVRPSADSGRAELRRVEEDWG